MVFGEGPEDRESQRKAKKTRESQRRPETAKESQRETENARESQRKQEKARKHAGDKLCVFNDSIVQKSRVFATFGGVIGENSHVFMTFLYLCAILGSILGPFLVPFWGPFRGPFFSAPEGPSGLIQKSLKTLCF